MVVVVVEKRKVVTSVSNEVVKDAKKIDCCSVRGVITCAGTLSRKGTRRQSRHVELTRKRLVREGAMVLLQADGTGTSSNRRSNGCPRARA